MCQDDQVWQARARKRADRAGRPLNRMPKTMHREREKGSGQALSVGQDSCTSVCGARRRHNLVL
ncbi:hypothetical protein NEOLEDRAFT_1141634 [Neolentinus lepideus HHB14362 ss-1]|uniref:Uncharacterized protein n=1 Tax=Neolentinus lepideus HHB14362 ss-1 TaxID=1314782 RepID=A0A165NK00_9AGAM|nr:hypothetical protein NEOLEDRAFT_1141634 [Neolentinus lepideus HHB14362 ss-1]